LREGGHYKAASPGRHGLLCVKQNGDPKVAAMFTMND
jgi:hypothetical protein